MLGIFRFKRFKGGNGRVDIHYSNHKNADDKLAIGYAILREGFEQMAKEDGNDIEEYVNGFDHGKFIMMVKPQKKKFRKIKKGVTK